MKMPSWIKNIYFRYFFNVKKGKCLFIPHPGFTNLDKASIINYKADNCLIFARYMLDNGLCQGKELVVVSTTSERAQKEQTFCKEHYPEANVRIIPNVSRLVKSAWASAEYIISSEMIFLYNKKKEQKYIVLGYYPVPTKKDWFPPIKGTWYEHRLEYAKQVDYVMSVSQIYSQIESSAFEVSLGKFIEIGRVRSDILLSTRKDNLSYIRDFFKEQCKGYKFSKIILYSPTHRDYEESEFDVKRSILGFDVNKGKFENFLKDNELLIVCKLHPRQNAEVVNMELPKGVVNFTGSDDFGLVELMTISDILMNDYSSAFIDYLVLDKPIIFNFYDFDKYKRTRGFSFYPFERICAGEIFKDEESFYEATKEALENPDKYKAKRAEVLDELITYRTDVCKKTYQYLFGK